MRGLINRNNLVNFTDKPSIDLTILSITVSPILIVKSIIITFFKCPTNIVPRAIWRYIISLNKPLMSHCWSRISIFRRFAKFLPDPAYYRKKNPYFQSLPKDVIITLSLFTFGIIACLLEFLLLSIYPRNFKLRHFAISSIYVYILDSDLRGQ